jgi:parvulin-like peptidyl-prolyl isomerase
MVASLLRALRSPRPSRWRWVPVVTLTAWCFDGAASAAEDPRSPPADVAAFVGGAQVSRGAVDAVVQRLNPAAIAGAEQRRRAEATVLEQLIDEQILRAALTRHLIEVAESEVKAGVERLKGQIAARGMTLEAFLAETGRTQDSLRDQVRLEVGLEKYVRPRMTPAVIEAAFAEHRRDLDGTRLKVSHIVLRPVIIDEDGVTKEMQEADRIRRDVLQGRLTFEEAARRHSAGPSRHRGGDLGWIARDGPMVDAFSRPVFALAKGEISKPFVTPFGIHVAKITEVEAGRAGLEAVRSKVERLAATRMIRELVAKGRADTPIRYAPGVPHFDPATPADGPEPRRVIMNPAAE